MRNRIGTALAILMCLPASSSFAAEKLIFALDLIRHGDRTPVVAMPKSKYSWKEGYGQLTSVGMRQEFELGKVFRQRYIESTNLLPRHYQQGTMYVRSTDYDRTLMSAQSLLMGMYPLGTGPVSANASNQGLPYAFQPIPIHSAPANQDNVILHHVDAKEREALMKKYVYSTAEWQQKENEIKKNFPRWSEASGFDIQSLDDLGLLGDTLYIYRLHNVAIPAGLTDEDVNVIIEASNFAFMAEEKSREIAAAYSRQLVINIADSLQKGTKEGGRLKYVLLSAHDSTIASTLGLLSAPLTITPPYASDLNFSLYESGVHNYVVKITYNGTPVTIPACGGAVCTLQRFVELAHGDTYNAG